MGAVTLENWSWAPKGPQGLHLSWRAEGALTGELLTTVSGSLDFLIK